MMYPSLFDSFFAPTRVIVVSEERLKAAEQSSRRDQLQALNNRIDELTKYRDSLAQEIKALEPKESKYETIGRPTDALHHGGEAA